MRNGEWAHSAFYAFYVLLLICQMDLKAAAGGPGGLKRRDKTTTYDYFGVLVFLVVSVVIQLKYFYGLPW